VNPPWWLGVRPVNVPLACGQAAHRLRWEAGQLLALDHGNPDGERVLAALGGDDAPCLAALRVWERYSHDSAVLELARRHPGDDLLITPSKPVATAFLTGPQPTFRTPPPTAAPPPSPPAGPVWGRAAGPRSSGGSPPSRAGREATRAATGPVLRASVVGLPTGAPHAQLPGTDRDEQATAAQLWLLGISAALDRRWQLGVATSLAAAWDPDQPSSAAAALDAATYGRLLFVLERWLRRSVAVELSLDDAREASMAVFTDRVDVRLRPDWLSSVWCRYLAVVDEFFVLEIRSIEARAKDLDAVDVVARALPLDGSSPVELVIAGPAPWKVRGRRPDRGVS
jgi:hypothetical protein